MRATCKYRVVNRKREILWYMLLTDEGDPVPISKENLKELLRGGDLKVDNLTLASDGKISARPGIFTFVKD